MTKPTEKSSQPAASPPALAPREQALLAQLREILVDQALDRELTAAGAPQSSRELLGMLAARSLDLREVAPNRWEAVVLYPEDGVVRTGEGIRDLVAGWKSDPATAAFFAGSPTAKAEPARSRAVRSDDHAALRANFDAIERGEVRVVDAPGSPLAGRATVRASDHAALKDRFDEIADGTVVVTGE